MNSLSRTHIACMYSLVVVGSWTAQKFRNIALVCEGRYHLNRVHPLAETGAYASEEEYVISDYCSMSGFRDTKTSLLAGYIHDASRCKFCSPVMTPSMIDQRIKPAGIF